MYGPAKDVPDVSTKLYENSWKRREVVSRTGLSLAFDIGYHGDLAPREDSSGMVHLPGQWDFFRCRGICNVRKPVTHGSSVFSLGTVVRQTDFDIIIGQCVVSDRNLA